jgi:hypothetical protein
MNERKIELTWVCTSCQHRNRGRDKVCAGCGDAKDASERFEMPGDTAAAASVTDPAVLAAARAGADWRCTFCRGDNRALDAVCKRCGSARGTTPASTDHLRAGHAAGAPGTRAASRSSSSGATWGVSVAVGSGVVTAAVVVGALGVMTVLSAVMFRIEPRDAPWFRWRAHQWHTSREATLRGTSEPLARPGETDLGEVRAVLEGCTETRLVGDERYLLTLATEAGHELSFVPPSIERFEQLAIGASVSVEVDTSGGLVRVLE